MILPHPPVLLSQIRVHDIWLLLAIGGMWEFWCRMALLLVKRKPDWLVQREAELFVLQQKTTEKRKLGPSAFVETSKLERQVLALEKELGRIQDGRKEYVCLPGTTLVSDNFRTLLTISHRRAEAWQKRLLTYGNIYLGCLIFFLYFSIPIISIESGPPVPNAIGAFESPGAFTRRLLFPLTYAGMGIRISRWGMIKEHAEVSIGALVVLWSAQTTVGRLMDAVDALVI
jgi:hypothetical protein